MPTPILVTGQSDIGMLRRRNEDSVALRPEHGIAVVADGMGGHPGGDVASRIAADVAAETLAAGAHAIDGGAGHDAVELMEHAIRSAHDAIRVRGDREPDLSGMGTTLTAMVVSPADGSFVIGHVGDSRCYRFRDGVLKQLTRDDTWVQKQIDEGVFTPEEARRNPYSHLLTQCLGLEDPPVAQVLRDRAAKGDTYLLCTDGLVGMLDDHEMERILSRLPTLSDDSSSATADDAGALAALLEAANDAGGHDNITAAMVRIAR